MIEKKTLYKNHSDSIGTWSIEQTDEHTIKIEFSRVIGGAIQEKTEYVEKGLASRTLQQQVESRINSRISRQRDKGYVDTMDEARSAPTNAAGLKPPMLAQAYKKSNPAYVRKALEEGFLSYKLDGHRCSSYFCDEDEHWKSYSRQGKDIPTIDHIHEELAEIGFPEDMDLDGELYLYGVPLQTIASWVKRKQADTEKIEYWLYDIMSDEPYAQRYATLKKYLENHVGKVKLLESIPAKGVDPIAFMKKAIDEGFEGAMLRANDMGYQSGRRSKSLIKIKHFEDAEAEVVDIEQSVDGWAILVCKIDAGVFRMSAPGTIVEKLAVWENKALYVGKQVTFQYASLTKDGLPFHASALRFRDDL